MEQVFHYYKVLLLQLGGFVISNTFLAPFIQTTLTLAINLLPRTMVSLTISSLFFTIVLPWIGPFFHEYPSSKPMLSFGAHAATVSGIGVSF